MSIADLVAAPDRRQGSLKTLAHVEFQLRVLGLLCAAAAEAPTKMTLPGSLDLWSRYIVLNRDALDCATCQSAALTVAESVSTEVASATSIRQMRNQVFHGGPDPENVDLDVLHEVVSVNANHVVKIYDHGHVSRIDPFFVFVNGELAALKDFTETSATYWPRRGAASDVTESAVLDELQQLVPQGGNRLFESFALDIQKDLRGFAERNSIYASVIPSQPIVVRWDLRTSSGAMARTDQFELNTDQARIWQSDTGPQPYKAFLADICNWEVLKERLLEELEEQVELESQISEELFPNLKPYISNVAAQVKVGGILGDGSNVTITEACERISAQTNTYTSYTNLITLTGEAGSGKTHSLLQFARDSLSSSDQLKPLAIYISSSGTSANSLDTLLDARMARTRILDKSSVLALCRAGLAILVIDGFDELLGFRTYDNPLIGLKPILDALRGMGTVILSARSSYSDARLQQSLDLHDTLDRPPYVTPLELVRWEPAQLRELARQLPFTTPESDVSSKIGDLLTTPFFCLAFVAWVQAGKLLDFLQFVVEAYLQRERRKLTSQGGIELFGSETLADIFSEVAELVARKGASAVSEEELELAASSALERELTREEKRRLIALCAISVEREEDDLSFKFTHLAIAEQFLARQITRLPISQAVALLFNIPVSALCAELIVSIWKSEHDDAPTEQIAALQERVMAATPFSKNLPGAISLGRLWAKVYATSDGPRIGRRITIDHLELSGAGLVTLQEAHIEHLILGPSMELLLKSSYIDQLDISKGP